MAIDHRSCPCQDWGFADEFMKGFTDDVSLM